MELIPQMEPKDTWRSIYYIPSSGDVNKISQQQGMGKTSDATIFWFSTTRPLSLLSRFGSMQFTGEQIRVKSHEDTQLSGLDETQARLFELHIRHLPY